VGGGRAERKGAGAKERQREKQKWTGWCARSRVHDAAHHARSSALPRATTNVVLRARARVCVCVLSLSVPATSRGI